MIVTGFRDSTVSGLVGQAYFKDVFTNLNGWDNTLVFPSSVRIGAGAGETGQQSGAVAVGSSAGAISQGANAIAIGNQAGQTGQQNCAIAIGFGAGQKMQGANAIAIGKQCVVYKPYSLIRHN